MELPPPYEELFAGDAMMEDFAHFPEEGQGETAPQTQNVYFEPSCDDEDLVLGLIPATAERDVHEIDLLSNFGVEHQSKKRRVWDACESKSRAASVDLNLSLGCNRAESPEDNALLPSSTDETDKDLPQPDDELCRFITDELVQLRERILDKLHRSNPQAAEFMADRYLHELRQKDFEIEILTQRNRYLEDRLKLLTDEVGEWLRHASYNYGMVSTLRVHLMNAWARGEPEGHGESDANDAASCSIGSPYARFIP